MSEYWPEEKPISYYLKEARQRITNLDEASFALGLMLIVWVIFPCCFIIINILISILMDMALKI